MWDLKQMLEKCKQIVPHDLAKQEAAKFKPGDFQRGKKSEVQYAPGTNDGAPGKGGGKGNLTPNLSYND